MIDKTITITVSLAEMNAVLAGLGQLPLGQVIELFTRLKTEAEAQVNAVPTGE